MPEATDHPCLSCGACCVRYRASFPWMELDSHGGTVPAELVEPVGPWHVAMKGTTSSPPRCVALDGVVGTRVRCTIHPLRSSSCREFDPAWERGEPNERCDASRAAIGLAPLTPADWVRLPEAPTATGRRARR